MQPARPGAGSSLAASMTWSQNVAWTAESGTLLSMYVGTTFRTHPPISYFQRTPQTGSHRLASGGSLSFLPHPLHDASSLTCGVGANVVWTQNNGDSEALNNELDALLQLVTLQARSKDGEPILTRSLSAMRKITPSA